MNKICGGCYYFNASELTEIGYCDKHCVRLHEKFNMKCISYVEKAPKEDMVNDLIEYFSKEIDVKYNEYIIWFSNDDNIKIRIKQDINRPNNHDDYELISEYISNNYKPMPYEIIELDVLEEVVIK